MSSCPHAKNTLPRTPLVRCVLPAFALFMLTLVLFAPSLEYAFVMVDDFDYIPANPIFTDGFTQANVRAIFTRFQQGMYAPLLWISYLLDAHLLGASYDQPRGFYLVNVTLHAVNAILLFILLIHACRRPWPAFFLAAFWAVHPLRVESVAWIAGRKDVLSGLFGLLCMTLYVAAHRQSARSEESDYADGPTSKLQYMTLYSASLICFALGLLVKPALVPLPFALLLLDYWPLRRMDFRSSNPVRIVMRLAAEKIPFFLLSVMAAVGTSVAHAERHALADIPLATRIFMAPVHYVFYLARSFFPRNLSPLYTDIPFQSTSVVLSVLILTVLSIWAWRVRMQAPAFIIGWLFFLGLLLPSIGLVRFGIQSIADRFVYFPSIGLSIALLPLMLDTTTRSSAFIKRPARVILAIGVVGAMAWASSGQLSTWRSHTHLLDRVLTVNPENPHGLAMRSFWLIHKYGRFEEARDGFRRIIQTEVFNPEVLNGKARCLAELEGPAAAMEYLLHIPATTNPYLHVARSWDIARYALMTGRPEKALYHAEQALQAFPHDYHERPEYLYLLPMTAAFEQGDLPLALYYARQFPAYSDKDAIELRDLLPYYLHQWMLFYRTDAYTFFKRLLDAHPEDVGLLNNIAWGLATANWSPAKPDTVLELAERAQRALPDHPGVWDTLAAAQANAGDFAAAIRSTTRALELMPDGDDIRAIEFRDRVRRRRALYEQEEPYREEAFARLMAAWYGTGLPVTRQVAP